MLRKVITYITYLVLIAVVVLCLVAVAQASTGNIDAVDKWAWGTNVGWVNFNPTHGGVTVYDDHLEGYAWGENIGWIRLGTHTGGSPHTYANTAADNYGVNRDANGNLLGYAWGTNVGWINFSPTHGGVTIDPDTGSFDGYAWGENVGWIHFKGTAPAYNVVTEYRPPPPVPIGGFIVPVSKVELLALRLRSGQAPWLGLAALASLAALAVALARRRKTTTE
jgi:hypothetical protein